MDHSSFIFFAVFSLVNQRFGCTMQIQEFSINMYPLNSDWEKMGFHYWKLSINTHASKINRSMRWICYCKRMLMEVWLRYKDVNRWLMRIFCNVRLISCNAGVQCYKYVSLCMMAGFCNVRLISLVTLVYTL